ncbi:MAG TPA: nucleoside triphosphate pyrophosphohydrolase [Armatimonadota bacterium]|jgi:tetrapyrrole methylase family protein/MazG family protein
MTPPYQITIVGLGPGDIELMSLQTLNALRQAPSVLLRTARHPAAEALPGYDVHFTACDDLYETHGTFEQVYSAVVARVVDAAERHGAVVYAVPGDPLVAEQTVQRLLALAGTRSDMHVSVLPALGALNLILDRVRFDPGDGMVLADARDPRLRPMSEPPAPEEHALYHGAMPLINPTLPTIWFQVDTAMVAGDLKIMLLEQYPADHPVTVLTALGAGTDEQVTTLALADLDRGPAIMHLTSLYVPALPWAQRKHTITDVRALMAMLRSERGCPWDREQDMRSMRRTIIEEAYEVVEAIDQDEPFAIADELGDLLLNLVFVAQLGAEEGIFDFDDVLQALSEKLIRRHAHVFGQVEADSATAVLQSWEKIKAGERKAKGTESIFDDVPQALPALARSQKLQKRAARVGFDWVDFRGPLLKLHEELEELQQELGITESWERPTMLRDDPLIPQPGIEERVANAPHARLVHEVGDILFAAVNLCRFVHLDAEEVMREANDRFVRRFLRVEAAVHARGQRVEDLTVAQLDEIWLEIKGQD